MLNCYWVQKSENETKLVAVDEYLPYKIVKESFKLKTIVCMKAKLKKSGGKSEKAKSEIM